MSHIHKDSKWETVFKCLLNIVTLVGLVFLVVHSLKTVSYVPRCDSDEVKICIKNANGFFDIDRRTSCNNYYDYFIVTNTTYNGTTSCIGTYNKEYEVRE